MYISWDVLYFNPSQGDTTMVAGLAIVERISAYICVQSVINMTWWRHQMETFSASLAICAGNSSVHGEFPAQRPVTRSFDVFFDVSPNKRLSKQSWAWWFETLSPSLWRHRNETFVVSIKKYMVSLFSVWGYTWPFGKSHIWEVIGSCYWMS